MTNQPRRLPIQIPLRAGENPEAFIRRLAAANHLRPSFLRFYANHPPRQIGSINAGRLACLTGRRIEELVHVMPSLNPDRSRPPRQSYPRGTHHLPNPHTMDLTTRLRLAAGTDETVIRLFQRFAVPRATIIKALTGQTPPPEQGDRTGPRTLAFQTITGRLDALIDAHPDAPVTAIFRTIRTEVQVPLGETLVRNYVNRARARPDDTRSIKYRVSRAEFFATIQDHAAGYDLIATLAGRFSTDRTTVQQALAAYTPPQPRNRKTLHNPSLEPLRHHIAEMITTDPAVPAAAIWERLVDDHHATVSYATVRDYVAREYPQRRRRRTRRA